MLGTDIPRKEIISIKFENTLERKSGRYWDISAKRDESVIGCAEKKETGYDFYIAANGKIIGNPDCKNLFRACECLVNIKFNGNFDTSYVTNMEYMFYDCFSLEELDIISLDTSQVTNMKGMFAECSCLTELRIDSFKTSNVIDMAGMFRNCKNLTTLNIQQFDTSQVADTRYMFGGCGSLRELYVDKLEMLPGANKNGMFDGYSRQLKLEKISARKNTLQSDEVKEVVKGKNHLLGTDIACEDIISITSLDTIMAKPEKYWDVSEEKNDSVTAWAVKKMDGYDFYIAGEGGVSGGLSCMYLFQDCVNLQQIEFNNCFDTSQVTDMRFMFSGCGSLINLDVTNFDTSKVTNMRAMFNECQSSYVSRK